MTPDEIQRLRDLAAKATPGPWEVRYLGENEADVVRPVSDGHEEIAADVFPAANAEYLAALSPDVVLALLDELEVYQSTERRNNAEIEALERDL